jgi:carboxymethylenebutenolidase
MEDFGFVFVPGGGGAKGRGIGPGEMGSFIGVTTAIAQFMRELERAWDAHREALLVRRDLAAALAPLAAEPSVLHIPAMTGAAGRPALERFYADKLLPHVPGDLVLSRISRTVDRWRLVEETTVSFTHDRVLPWLLPGVEPTFRRAEVLAIAVVGFERGRIRSQRVLWDHATLAAQLGLGPEM